jgi:hypothetical protein
MGGKGSGGSRIASGRKGKDAASRWLSGTARKAPPAGDGPDSGASSASAAPFAILEPPAELEPAVAAVWSALAPHAAHARTLTHGTATAFRDLCEAIVLRRTMLRQIAADGLTIGRRLVDDAGVEYLERRAHPLLTHQRNMLQRIEAGMVRYGLLPIGKPLADPAPAAADPWAEFDAPAAPDPTSGNRHQ